MSSADSETPPQTNQALDSVSSFANSFNGDPGVNNVLNNCAVKSVMSGVLGGALGFAIGAFFSTSMTPIQSAANATEKSTWVQVKEHFKESGRNGKRYAKGFGMAGALYVGSECVIEKFRGRSDIYNAIYGGCAAGAMLSIRGGPQSAAVGCAGFAVFSGLIETYMGH